MSDTALLAQAQALAEKAVPGTLSDPARSQRLLAVRQKIFERLQKQREEAGAFCAPGCGNAAAATVGNGPAAEAFGCAVGWPPPPPPPPPPPLEGNSLPSEEEQRRLLKVEGVELCGDEAWFSDPDVRGRLRESIVEAHQRNKILVGTPAVEVARICPEGERTLGAGAVLRLGGSSLGGFGEADIAYAYRQLSRALHPDKNPNLADASAAFQRLSEAADELRKALAEQRAALQVILGSLSSPPLAQEMLERPQEALFAEACRLLSALCSLEGEGWMPSRARRRATAAFAMSAPYVGCQPPLLLSTWFNSNTLLDLCGSPPLRAAYDCSPKRFRAQFLCLLNRAVLAEAVRSQGCVRRGWSQVLEAFPELTLWRNLRDGLSQRVWDEGGGASASSALGSLSMFQKGGSGRSRSRSRRRRGRSDSSSSSSSSPNPREAIVGHQESKRRASRWALKWRGAIAAILPSGLDGAVRPSDLEVRKLAKAMWKDVATWACNKDQELERALSLFRADSPGTSHGIAVGGNTRGLPVGFPPAEWAFIPVSDLFLTVGEGLVGISTEGIFAANRRGHERKSLAKCYKKS